MKGWLPKDDACRAVVMAWLVTVVAVTLIGAAVIICEK